MKSTENMDMEMIFWIMFFVSVKGMNLYVFV